MQNHTNDGPLREHQPEAGSSRQASRAACRRWCERCARLTVPVTVVVVVVIPTAAQAATPGEAMPECIGEHWERRVSSLALAHSCCGGFGGG